MGSTEDLFFFQKENITILFADMCDLVSNSKCLFRRQDCCCAKVLEQARGDWSAS